MRVCLMIEGQEDVSWDEWVTLAQACEEHGFDALFRSDHYMSLMGFDDREATDAWAVLSALAAVTTRLRLGTLVSPATFRHPSQLAKVAATADHISGGRIELGMGAGWNQREHAAYGFPFPDIGERYDIFEEQVEIVRRQLTEPEVSFSGEHYTLDAVRALPHPVQSPLPLIIGGDAGPRSARIAASWADEYNTLGTGPDEAAKRRRRLAEAWQDAGRDPDDLRFSLMTGCIVGADDAEVHERARVVLDRTGQSDIDPAQFIADRRDRWIIGTPAEVTEQLGLLADVGVERIMLQHLNHRDLEMIAMLGQEVIPAVD